MSILKISFLLNDLHNKGQLSKLFLSITLNFYWVANPPVKGNFMNRNNGMIDDNKMPEVSLSGKKIFCGLAVFIVAILSPLFIPLIIQLDISPELKAIISGFLVFGLPEIGILLAVAILGKDGFVYLKSRLLFWLKRTVISTGVSRFRYRFGIILFSTTFFISFLIPYINYFSTAPVQKNHYYLNFLLDFLFLISLFILGGNFWDKLRSLFLYDMVAVEIKKANSKSGND